jgi:DNA-binding SARP family transcriptional activator/tetratricopeptide (TPR) repeat protein
MWLAVLGPLHVQHGDCVIPVPSAKQRIVLGALLAQGNQVVSFDRLAEAVWDGVPPRTARVTLRSYVKRLRQITGPEVGARIRTRDPGYRIEIGDAELDLIHFRKLCESGGAAVRGQAWERADADLAAALELWRGAPFADIPSDSLRRDNVTGLEQLRLQALEWWFEARLHLHRHEELVPLLQAMIGQQPLRERFRGQLMLALYRCGRQADALAAYREAHRVLVEQLGVEPGPELSGLHQRILNADPLLQQPARAGGTRIGGTTEAGRWEPAGPPRQLPPLPRYFTGRADELAVLDRLAQQAASAGGTIVISAIGGAAGVGKSALALYWAHQAAERFPDGQLYVNLRGFDPSGTPVPPTDAIRGFLAAFHVPPSAIPAGLQAQAGLYRSLLADRRMLIVLDNARDSDQVRPLLAGGPGCLVIVTSRNQLTGLVVSEGAHPVPLDLFTEPEARELLARRLGARLTLEPAAAADLIRLCARLPLALSITAARAAANPHTLLTAFAAELAEARLDALATGEEATDVRAVFSWSYQHLSEPAARLFRLLGGHPGPDISVAAAVSMAGRPRLETRKALAELAGAHLLLQSAPGRFAFHDLLRAYAGEQACARDSLSDRRAAFHRLADHYLHSAHVADQALYPTRDPIALPDPVARTDPEQFSGEQQAMAWFDAEHQVLVACVAGAAANGFYRHAWQLARALETFFYRRGHWHDWAATQRAAIAATDHLDDAAAQAFAHREFASASCQLRSFDDTFRHNAQALRLYQKTGDRVGQARVHLELGRAYDRLERFHESIRESQQALELFQHERHQIGIIASLNQAGWAHALLGEHTRAAVLCQQALDLMEAVGDRHNEAPICDSLGYIHCHLGNHEQAAQFYRRALHVLEQREAHPHRAETLTNMGDALHAAGDPEAAREAWQQALAILERLHHPDAGKIRDRLRLLGPSTLGSQATSR